MTTDFVLDKPKIAIDDSLSVGFGSELALFIEDIIVWVELEYGRDELIKGKEEFYVHHGKVFHGESFFNSRMNFFLDFFLFHRKIKGEAPYQAWKREKKGEELVISGAEYSLFEILKLNDKLLIIKNLFKNQKLIVTEFDYEGLIGVQKNDIFQGFIYSSDEKLILSRALIFHPHRSKKLIKRTVKKELKKGLDDENFLLCSFAKMQLKHLRHAHVDPRNIYIELDS